jgi:Mn2+/Fe2+ NRAMP family transporter
MGGVEPGRLLHHADHRRHPARARRDATCNRRPRRRTALKPIAGELAFVLFALGIVGTGLLAIPVLAGSAAYAMAGTFHWKSSLEHEPKIGARKFYGIIIVATLAGVGLNFAPIDPIKALYWSAVLNGVIAVPVMAIMMLVASRPPHHGRPDDPAAPARLGWLCTGVMAAAVTAMFVTLVAALAMLDVHDERAIDLQRVQVELGQVA